ncbi:peptidoglycan recognition family protein [Gulosibacter sp. GYB002]|uniref:N-acetylmuramoyl-L-alanine amidase n=1 Tax=Gulosibacter sp. GYB002 TaxID=2994391 RepID=UPI002F96DE1D
MSLKAIWATIQTGLAGVGAVIGAFLGGPQPNHHLSRKGEPLMKNWATLEADENRLMNKHYSAGRSGRKINKVIIHHNAGNLTIKSIWDVWQTRQASAHYQVDSGGRIGQLVWDRDTAWHAGNWEANTTSIGIEHADISSKPWRISEACLDNGARSATSISLPPNARPRWQEASMRPTWHAPSTGTTA